MQEAWVDAMEEEIKMIQKNNTWEPLGSNRFIILRGLNIYELDVKSSFLNGVNERFMIARILKRKKNERKVLRLKRKKDLSEETA